MNNKDGRQKVKVTDGSPHPGGEYTALSKPGRAGSDWKAKTQSGQDRKQLKGQLFNQVEFLAYQMPLKSSRMPLFFKNMLVWRKSKDV